MAAVCFKYILCSCCFALQGDFTSMQRFCDGINMKTHKLTKHSSTEQRKMEFKFYCEKCDFRTFGELLYTRHLETKKHIN